ncbi:MAG: ethanolamine ammonia-lyase subunit EutB, partial [Pseudomonadota bacterium]
MIFRQAVGTQSYVFATLRELLAKATPPRSGDRLAGIAAETAEQMIAARMALADVPLSQFLQEMVVPYEDDEVTRLIVDRHDASAFAPISALTVGGFRDWLLSDAATPQVLQTVARGITPEMAAAVSKLMRNQDLILVARKCEVITRFRNTIGLRGCMSVRLQPNHPFDNIRGITASILDGLMLGSGDACIGINPASDDPAVLGGLVRLLDEVITKLDIPTQSCVLTHVTTSLDLINQGAPVDLVFQSIAGTEAANRSFGIDLAILKEAQVAGLSLKRGTLGQNVMYFETGQGSALSA